MNDEPTVATPIHDARGCRILIRGGRADIQRPVDCIIEVTPEHPLVMLAPPTVPDGVRP